MWKMMIGPMAASMTLAMASVGVGMTLADPQALVFFAVLLGGVAGVGAGLGLADGRRFERNVELAAAAAFVLLAGLGLWRSPLVVAGGFMAHGVWNGLHHPRLVATVVAPWYPPVAALFDMILAGYVSLRWMGWV